MASKKLTFNIALEQNKNMESTGYGKWYGKTYSPNEALNLKGLVQRVAMDQSVFSEDIARGVIDRLTVTMVELLQSGQSVKWDQLGTFRPTVESVGVNQPTDYNVNTDVKGIHIRFIPENAKGEEITSRMFADMCTMMTAGVWTVEKVRISGKQKSVRRFRPMASFAAQGSSGQIPTVAPILVDAYYTVQDPVTYASTRVPLPFADGKFQVPAAAKSKYLYFVFSGLTVAGNWSASFGSTALREMQVHPMGAAIPNAKYRNDVNTSGMAAGEVKLTITAPESSDPVELGTFVIPA